MLRSIKNTFRVDAMLLVDDNDKIILMDRQRELYWEDLTYKVGKVKIRLMTILIE